jgi:hypothetical protein
MCETTMNNNGQRFSTTAGSDGKPSPPRTGFDPPPPSSSFPVDPDFCVTTPFQLLTLTLSYCQSDISNPTLEISRHFTFNLKSTMTKIYFKWPLQGLLSLLMTEKIVKQKTGAGGYLLLCPNSRHYPFKARQISTRNVSMEESLQLSGHLGCL